jgi:ATP-dependent Clp protease ATP-binding subunit ClpC
MGYRLELTPEAKDFIAEKGYDAQFGARPFETGYSGNTSKNELAIFVLSGELETGDTILMDLDKENGKIKAKNS